MTRDRASEQQASVSGARRRTFWPTAAVIVFVACVLRFSALDLGLPNQLARPDEEDVLRVTLLPASGEFDLGWAVYPSAYVYLTWIWNEAGLSVSSALGGSPRADYATTWQRNPARIYLISRSLSAVSGVAAVGLLILLARRTLGDASALVAGLLLATSFLHARDSHAAKPDALFALGVVVAFLAMVPLTRRATAATGALAGLGVGGAMAAKYPGVVLLVPVYVAAAMQGEGWSWRRLAPVPVIVATAVAAAVFIGTSPYLVLNRESVDGMVSTVALAFPEWFPEQSEAAAASASLVDPIPLSDEYGSQAWWGGLLRHARFSLWYGAGKLATLLALPAVVWGLLCRQPIAILASSFVLSYFLIVGLSPSSLLARYLTPVLPVLYLLEAGLLAAAARRWGGRHWKAVLALAAVAVATEPLWSALQHNRIAAQADTRVLATRWMRQRLPRGARVVVYGTRFYPWGAPEIPAKLNHVAAEPEAGALEAAGVGYLVTHDHELFYSSVAPDVMAGLRSRLTLEAAFRPFDPERARPVFEEADAYYIPFHGFSGVDRGGPQVKIYRFE